jgi:hypothetical protein
MIRTPIRCIFAALALITFATLSGCSPAVTLKIDGTNRTGATFEATLSPTAENLVRKLADREETASPGAPQSLYDREAILVSLGNAGFRADSLEFPGRAGIRLALTLLKSEGFLGNALSVSRENKKVSVAISRDTLERALALMPTETRDYLDLFMAPAFTGEELTEGEYREIIAAAYGKTLAAELAASTFTLTVQCPAKVSRATVSAPGTVVTASNAAVFRIPLTTLLVLEAPITAEANW